MSARAVASFREPFSPTGMRFYDAGVALDEIESLTSNVEPVVLRVSSHGVSDTDWLCADHDPPRRIRRPDWEYSFQSRRWSESKTWLDAWELCEDGVWLAHAAAAVGLSRRLVVAAACACVRRAPGACDGESGAVLFAAERWALGAVSDADLAGAAEDASHVIDRNVAAMAARSAAMAAVAGPVDHVAGWAANAVELSAHLLSLTDDPGAYRRARRRNRSVMADAFRRQVPTLDVLRAALEG